MDQQQLAAAWQCRGHATWKKDGWGSGRMWIHSRELTWMDPKQLHGLEKGVPFNCFGFLVSMLDLGGIMDGGSGMVESRDTLDLLLHPGCNRHQDDIVFVVGD